MPAWPRRQAGNPPLDVRRALAADEGNRFVWQWRVSNT